MAKKKTDDVELLLSKLGKKQLGDFIRKECGNDSLLRDRFLALGAGTLFNPNAQAYTSRVEDLIEAYAGRHGFIEYRDTFDFNVAVSRILDEAADAMLNHQWGVAIAVLSGIAAAGEDIINSGDDSAGALGGIVDECFLMWNQLCEEESLPENFRSEIFELALNRFIDRNLKGWDWWWNWMDMAIKFADTPERQDRIFKALDAVKPDDNDWSAEYAAQTAQKYKLELMSKCGTPEEQRKFMYENVANPDFRKRLMQIAWDKADYKEVLRLAQEGLNHDAEWAGLVSDWRKWEYKVYEKIGDTNNILHLARYFFFSEGRWGEKEYSFETMYSTLKNLIANSEWDKYVETLVSEAQRKKDTVRLLYIYTQERMWNRYIEYLRKNPSTCIIDEAPKELKELFKEEIIGLYAAAVKVFFQRACNRDSYREGVSLLRNLIKYGGKSEADKIVIEQKSRTPRRPALIDELSRL